MLSSAWDGFALADQDRQERRDAAHECVHGRLPDDRTPECGCWGAVVIALRPQATAPDTVVAA